MKKKKLLIILIILFTFGIIVVFSVNAYVKNNVNEQILSVEEAIKINDIDAILVLGCRANKTGPSQMLQTRLDKGIELYNQIDSTKLLLSGDHGHFEYDEVNTMRDYTLSKDIDSVDIFMDHAGFSTYESIYRAKEIFLAKKVLIVTQEYHLYRSLYIAKKLGLKAYGVSASDIEYGQFRRDVREVLARNKDYVKVIFKPKPTYLGEVIPISGDGNVTVD